MTLAVVALLMSGCADRGALPTAPDPGSIDDISAAPPDPRENEDYEPKVMPGPGRKPAKFCETAYPFRSATFTNPLRIDNEWAPLIPGTQYVLTGVANRGLGFLPHEVVFTVTDVVKMINGVPCLTLWDRDFQNGVLAEEELAFFAQDDQSTIWSMGEYPEEFDIVSGEFQGAPNTWIAGIGGTEAGNWMLGDLRRGKGYYSQGFSAPIEFLDCATVMWTRVNTCVPVGCFSNVLVIDEYGPFDLAGGHQRKFYAKGVGNVRIGAVNDPEGETLVMTARRMLTPTELAQARAEVLRLDQRGMNFNEVYAQTSPAY
jgi:hypothetical protein